MALIDKLTAVANAIRGKTGGTEPLTLDQMAVAITGIQTGGGSSGGASGIYMAKVTPTEDLSEMTITHNLGTTDILLAACWAETLGDIVPTRNGTLAKFHAKTDIATQRAGGWFGQGYAWNATNSYAATSSPNMGSYEALKVIDANTISINRTASGTTPSYFAGVTYTVIVIAANAEV
jgi:hypothetical protein